MTQYGFHFDGTRCSGCKTCTLACKDRYDLSSDIAYRQVYEYGEGSWKKVDDETWTTDAYTYYISSACNHCTKPACVEACPQSSMKKDEETGIVYNDPETCIGCGACVSACPYNAPKVDSETNVSMKCDLCLNRIKAGKDPICVEACPLRALSVGEIEGLRSNYGDVAAIAPLPDPDITKPNVVITEPKNAKPVDDTSGALMNEIEIVL